MNSTRKFCLRTIALVLFLIILQASLSPLPVLARFIPLSPIDRPARSSAIPAGQLLFSAARDGAWNIYAVDALGGGAPLTRLTNINPARDPAVSPDGRTIAFRSKRDGIWDLYSMSIAGGALTKLSRGVNYSGAPAWSPDGKKIAFEAMTAGGNLNIWTTNADGSGAVNLTGDSKAHDYAPAWSPDGKWIAFTSWRTGTQQIFITDAACTANCKALNSSSNKFDDTEPTWSPGGVKLAFVSDRDGQRAIYTSDFNATGLKNITRLTFSGWDDQPAWSPDGNFIAFISARPTRTPVYIVPAQGGLPRIVDNSPDFAASVTWTANIAITGDAAQPDAPKPLYKETPDLSTPGSGHPYDLRMMRTTRLDGGLGRLNSRVADSFTALQTRVKQEVGYDFMASMADLTRPLDSKCDETCDTLSWHKAGRAMDTRLDYSDARGGGNLEIVREDMLGETYWHVYLRTASQDGTLGEPLVDAPWDLSYRARWIVAPGEGGIRKNVPAGFYVDFTELARAYGWQHISSHDEDNFDWKSNKLGAEYWHFQKTDGAKWFPAMAELYPESDLKSLAEWNALVKTNYDQYLLFLKAVPAPGKAWRWFALTP